MPLDEAIERSERWMEACASGINDLSFEPTTRNRVALALLHLCMEHQQAVHVLMSHQVHGSAFTLLRPQFEAYVRGVWFARCASEEQVAKFTKGWEPPKMGHMIQAIEKTPGHEDKGLSKIKEKIWGTLNEFTHGGLAHVATRAGRGPISVEYKEKNLVGLLKWSATLCLLACVAICDVVGQVELASKLRTSYRSIYVPAAA